jgi:hypothetical protein
MKMLRKHVANGIKHNPVQLFRRLLHIPVHYSQELIGYCNTYQSHHNLYGLV